MSKRRVILVGGIAVILLGAIFVVDSMISNQEHEVALIPHIASTGDIKERPEQPGGIDIPHRDVAVFDQLDDHSDALSDDTEETTEQLLPLAEPVIEEGEATGEEVIASMEKAVTESLEAELNKAAETLPPAVTEALLDGEPESLLGEEPEALPSVAPPEGVTPKVKSEEPLVPEESTTKVVEPVKEHVQDAVKKAEETMKVKAPETPEVPEVPKDTAVKAKPATTPKPEVVTAPKEPARLPADLFTQGETASSGVTKRLQLGSFRSEDVARKASEVLQKKHKSYLTNVLLKVVRADLGAKGIYYRVMSNPLPESTAKSICKSITAAQSACILAR